MPRLLIAPLMNTTHLFSLWTSGRVGTTCLRTFRTALCSAQSSNFAELYTVWVLESILKRFCAIGLHCKDVSGIGS